VTGRQHATRTEAAYSKLKCLKGFRIPEDEIFLPDYGIVKEGSLPGVKCKAEAPED